MSTEQSHIGPHPDQGILMSYIESPKSDKNRVVQGHIVRCVRCRKEIVHLQNMLETLQNTAVPPSKRPEGTHPDLFILAKYTEKKLSGAQQTDIREHLSTCGYCTKAVLEYATSTIEMEREEPVLMNEQRLLLQPKKVKNPGADFFSRFRPFFSGRMPVWIGAPATALAIVALFFLIFSDKNKAFHVVSYQDHPELVFGAKNSSFGFSDTRRIEAFGGIKIELQGINHLRVKWSPVKGAVTYEFKVFFERSEIGKEKTSGKIDVIMQVSSALIPGKRYEWVLSGKTADEKEFLTEGGFVVGQH